MTLVPEYIAERVRRPVPESSLVIPGSTPVVSFGNAETAWVATLGLNPSLREFADARRNWLTAETGSSARQASCWGSVPELLRHEHGATYPATLSRARSPAHSIGGTHDRPDRSSSHRPAHRQEVAPGHGRRRRLRHRPGVVGAGAETRAVRVGHRRRPRHRPGRLPHPPVAAPAARRPRLAGRRPRQAQWGFDGAPATELQHLIGRDVSHLFHKGAANPVSYLNC